jgi:pyruvate/2-oxoglutarate/acetoin dehydrogenase E1 component
MMAVNVQLSACMVGQCGYVEIARRKFWRARVSLNLRETIRDLTNQHLDAGHLVMGQCLTAVGFVAGTLPERQDMTELPMSDVAGAGFAVGAALAGRRPIYVVRYQGFMWYNAAMIVNYAAKSKAIWGRPCPLLIRSIAMEGGIGPVAGSSHHSLFLRMPGVKIFSPMTPGEWRAAYDEFMDGDDVVYLSEHRKAYDQSEESSPIRYSQSSDVVLFPISITRFAAFEAAYDLLKEKILVEVHPIVKLKPFPFSISNDALLSLYLSKRGVVLDDDYPDGTAKALALDLHNLTGARMHVLGLEDRTAGFSAQEDNLPPGKERIKAFIKELTYDGIIE